MGRRGASDDGLEQLVRLGRENGIRCGDARQRPASRNEPASECLGRTKLPLARWLRASHDHARFARTAGRAERAFVLGRDVHVHGCDRLLGRRVPRREVSPRRCLGRLRSASGDDQAKEGRRHRRDVLGEPAWGSRRRRDAGRAPACHSVDRCRRRVAVDQRPDPDVDGPHRDRGDGGVRRRGVVFQLGLRGQRR